MATSRAEITHMPHRTALALLALLATVAYAPMATVPLFEDDFPNLWQAQVFGSPADALALFQNPVFRLRATSYWMMFALWRLAKLAPLLYRLTSLLLHIQYLASIWSLPGMAANAGSGVLGSRLFRRRGRPSGSCDVVFRDQ